MRSIARQTRWVLLLAVLLALPSCRDPTTVSAPPTERADPPPALETPGASDRLKTPIDGLAPVDAAELQQYIRNQSGEVVLLDFWATWCAPCVESFPATVAIQQKYAKAGLRVAAVSLDDPKNPRQVTEFLDRHHVTFDRLISRFGKSQNSMSEFDLPAVPLLQLYDRRGALRYRFVAEPHSDDLRAMAELEIRIRELLDEKE